MFARSICRSILACSCTTLFVHATASAATLQVPAAFATIQDAIDAAAPGDTVLVAPGTYHERIDFLGKEIVVKASAADPTLTVIDADFLGTAVTIGGGVGPDAKLIGFSIREGDSTSGGGLDIIGSPTIRSCRFTLNDATSGGAAWVNGDASFFDCVFVNNDATGGGAISGTGLITIDGCHFEANNATAGGALQIIGDLILTDSTFVENTATVASSLDHSDGLARIDRCSFHDPLETVIRTDASLAMANTLVSEGSTAIEGLSNVRDVEIVLIQTTLVNPGSQTIRLVDGGNDTTLFVRNSILRQATNAIVVAGSGGGAETINVAYSNVEGGAPGTGNIDANAGFVAPGAGDFRLASGSPCIDAGTNLAVPATSSLDLAGNDRFMNDATVTNTGVAGGAGGVIIVDMGAYEAPNRVRYVNAAATGANNGLTWTDAYTDLQDALGDAAASSTVEAILVASGVYQPDRGTGDRTRSFNLVPDCRVQGGFEGTEQDLSEAQPDLFVTTLSGAIGAAGVADNSLHVVQAINVGADAELHGFVVQRGYADGPAAFFADSGAGMLIVNAAPTVRDCWFRQNEAIAEGGAIYSFQSDPGFGECRFNLNIAGGNGSALAFSFGTPILANSLVHGNDSGGAAAIMVAMATNILLVNVTVADNTATGGLSGGIAIDAASSAVVRNAILWKNQGLAAAPELNQINAVGFLDIGWTTVDGWSGAFGGAANNGFNPNFANPVGPDLIAGNGDDDYRLKAGSPAIDSANSAWLTASNFPVDLAGTDRFIDAPGSPNFGAGPVAFLDRGAYEFEPFPCPSDLNGDGLTDAADLAILLGAWGPGAGPADLDGSGGVNAADLAILLGSFGPC
jgi:predicted outer membrane repeat protein